MPAISELICLFLPKIYPFMEKEGQIITGDGWDLWEGKWGLGFECLFSRKKKWGKKKVLKVLKLHLDT